MVRPCAQFPSEALALDNAFSLKSLQLSTDILHGAIQHKRQNACSRARIVGDHRLQLLEGLTPFVSRRRRYFECPNSGSYGTGFALQMGQV